LFSNHPQRTGEMQVQDEIQESTLSDPVMTNSQQAMVSTQCQSSGDEQVLPVLYRDQKNNLKFVQNHLKDYISNQLDVSRLNGIHDHLWLAGRPMSARPLHRQIMMGRDIVLTEQADLHLTWTGSRIFVKPLPWFLLDFNFWEENICPHQELHALACGFLVSYIWLVCQPSDLNIGVHSKILPTSCKWQHWVDLVRDFTENINIDALDNVNKRYLYGELRVRRLSKIYRFAPKFRLKYLFRGYQSRDTVYGTFFEREFAWLLILFVYISIVLSSAQVGLATDKLQHSLAFQRISFGLTMFCIFLPAVFLCLMVAWFSILFSFHLFSTLRFQIYQKRGREAARKRKRNSDV
jgi:hypothetical protein